MSPAWRASSVLQECTPPPPKLPTPHQHTTVPVIDLLFLNAKRALPGPRKPKLPLREKLQAMSACSSAPPRLSSARISIRPPAHHVTLDTRALEIICLPIPSSLLARKTRKKPSPRSATGQTTVGVSGLCPRLGTSPCFLLTATTVPEYEREIRKKRSGYSGVLPRSLGQLTNLRFASVRHECWSSRMPVWTADRKADEVEKKPYPR
jgi:hypothetical protein